MGHSVDLASRTRRNLTIVVGAVTALVILGMAVLWPGEVPAPEQVGAPLIDATITSIQEYEGVAEPTFGLSGRSAIIGAELSSGVDRGTTVLLDTQLDGLPPVAVGDRVKLTSFDDGTGVTDYFIADFERTPALIWLALLFVVVVLAVSGWQGARSLVGLAFSLLVITRFVVPAILTGESPWLVALVGGMAVMLATLYLAHGISVQTTSAVIGTTVALVVTVGLGLVFIDQAALTGFSSEEANFARVALGDLDLRGLVLAGLIIATLGVLDDVTVSQASTVYALHDTDPSLTVRTLMARAMRVGRDHIASTINTLFLAYAGASLALLIVFSTGGLGIREIVNSEVLAEEIVKTIVGSIGLISAVPVTTFLAALYATRRSREQIALSRDGHAGHVH